MTLMKEITDDTNRWRDIPRSWIGINLLKEVKDLYSENYKTLMKEIKDDI